MKPIIIGLVGEASSGKGEIAKLLQPNGFAYFSLSDSLRKIATSLHLPHDREILINIGNTLRDTFGTNILARGAQRWINDTGNTRVIIDSIRNPGEVLFLQQELGAFVIGVTMSPEKRFELIRERKRPGDPQTWEEFQRLFSLEQGIGEKSSGIQVKQCLDLTDATIQNEGTIGDLHTQVREFLFSRGILLEGVSSNREKLIL